MTPLQVCEGVKPEAARSDGGDAGQDRVQERRAGIPARQARVGRRGPREARDGERHTDRTGVQFYRHLGFKMVIRSRFMDSYSYRGMSQNSEHDQASLQGSFLCQMRGYEANASRIAQRK